MLSQSAPGHAAATVATAVSILLLLAAVACRDVPPPAEPVVRPVRVQAVAATGGGRDRTFSGVARAGVESTLSFRVSGTIEELPVRVGQRVIY